MELIAAQKKVTGRKIKARLLITQSNPAIRSRSSRQIEQQVIDSRVPLYQTRLHERAPFEAMFLQCKSLRSIDDISTRWTML